MALDAGRVVLHLDLDDSQAKQKQNQFLTNAKHVSMLLNLDTSQAVQSFQNFLTQVTTQPVNAVLKLDTAEPKAVAVLELKTEESKNAYQQFVSNIQSQNIIANLKLNTTQAKKNIRMLSNQNVTANLKLKHNQVRQASVALHLDTKSASRKLELFLQKIRNANPTLRLNFRTDSATARFQAFRNHVRNTNFNSQLHLHTADAQNSLNQLINRIKHTNLYLKNSDTSMKSLNTTAQSLGNTLKSLFATGAVIAWGKACVNASSSTENAFRGLQSILNGQGRNFSDAQNFINEYIADGLIPLQNAVTAYKNLASRGYDDTQIQNVLTALKDSASYGRQASYSLGDAVTSATEGLKNENSILVDNAGVTKNVAKMWQDYAQSIGTTSASLTQQQKIQAEVNGILEETKFQTGDALKIADSFSGKVSKLAASLTALKVAVGNILTGALSPFISYLTIGIQKMTVFAESIGELFGFTGFSANSAISDSLKTASSDTDALTEALETAQNTAENLGSASFDNFNIIGSSDSDTTDDDNTALESDMTVSPILDMSDMNSALEKSQNQFSENLKKLFQPFRTAWNNYGSALLDSVTNAGEKVKFVFHSIGKSFSEIWTNRTGEEIVSTILQISENIFDTLGNIAERFATAWNDGTGTSIIQHLADIFQNVLDTVNHCAEATSNWAEEINFSPILTAFDNLLEKLNPFTEHIGEGLEWFYQNTLLPLADWTIEDALPAFLDTLSGAVTVLDTAIEALKPFGLWLWDEFIQPIAGWTGEIITTGLENLSDVLCNIGDWIKDNPNASVSIGALTGAFLGLTQLINGGLFMSVGGKIIAFAGKLSSLDVTIGVIAAGIVAWGYVITELSNNWEDICDVFEESGGVFGFLSGWLEYVREDVEEFFNFGDFGQKWFGFWETVGEVIYTVIHEKIPDFFKSGIETVKGLFSGTKSFFETVLENITSPFRNIADWFRNTFSDAWQKVKEVFSSGGSAFQGIESGISGIFKNTVNSLIDGINNVIYTPFQSINDALHTVRDWGIWLPWAGDWYPFQYLPEIGIPQIPRLAKGGLVNQPTLAMVGDNPNARNDPEVISPLSKLKSMLADSEQQNKNTVAAKLDMIITMMQILIDIVDEIDPVLQISDKEIYTASERGHRKIQKMKGKLSC